MLALILLYPKYAIYNSVLNLYVDIYILLREFAFLFSILSGSWVWFYEHSLICY